MIYDDRENIEDIASSFRFAPSDTSQGRPNVVVPSGDSTELLNGHRNSEFPSKTGVFE